MIAPAELLPYVPVVVWATTGIGLVAAFRRSQPAVLLRLAAAFLALWALVATTLLLWVLDHGGAAAVGSLLSRPELLFASADSGLWAWGGLLALGLLAAAFLVNQGVGHGLLRLLRPRPLPWPGRLRAPATRTFLGRFDSDRPEAFSFTLLDRSPGRPWRPARREVILVSEGLLRALSPAEQEAVVAHELGHLEALDSRYLTFLRTAARVVRWDPFFALLARSLTRREELRADRLAVHRTGDPRALLSALERIATLPPEGPRLVAGRAFLGGRVGGSDRLLEERIARLRSMIPPVDEPEDA